MFSLSTQARNPQLHARHFSIRHLLQWMWRRGLTRALAHRSALTSGVAMSTVPGLPAVAAPRAAVCVIGNEVLTGKTQDTNSHFIAKLMFRRGVDLVRVVVIPDVMEVISSTVKELSDLVGPTGYVFTTGGIGPTHDDITYEGVAKAFGRGVAVHEPTLNALREAMLKRGYGDMNEDRKRMAILPENCEVLKTSTWTPIAVVHNVYILPGIPSMVRDMLTVNEDRFVGVPIHRAIVDTLKYEGDIATPLTAVQNAHPGVVIGSYINLTDEKTGIKDESYNTRLTIEGRDEQEVEQVAHALITSFEGFKLDPNAIADN